MERPSQNLQTCLKAATRAIPCSKIVERIRYTIIVKHFAYSIIVEIFILIGLSQDNQVLLLSSVREIACY